MAAGSNLTDVQALNARTVFDTIRLEGPISRAAIARRLDLATPTISNIVRTLLDKGLLLERPGTRTGRGKPPIDLCVDPTAGYALGLNFDRDRLVGVLVDLAGTTIERLDRTIATPHPEEVLPALTVLSERLIEQSGVPCGRIWGTGVSVPGPLHLDPVDVRSDSEYFELPGWRGLDVRSRLSEALSGSVILENDAVAAAIGESWWGEGRHLTSFFFVYFGLYLGGAAVVNGTVNRGYGGFANEFGSIPVPSGPGGDGSYVPLGAKVSLAALLDHLAKHDRAGVDLSELGDPYRADDRVLEAWLDDTAERLTPVMATIDCLFDPEAIIFGERFPKVLVERLLARIEALLPRFAVPYKPRRPRLVRGWVGDDAAAKGAATLPLYRALHPDVFVMEAIGGSGRKEDRLPDMP